MVLRIAPGFVSRFTLASRNVLIVSLAGAAGFFLLFVLVDWSIERALDEERNKMLFALHLRADSLAGAIESAARFMRGRGNDLGNLMEETSRQPGIAWIALVSPTGRILQDSNPGLSGSLLYTPLEMEELRPDLFLRSRFAPDDPDIYETWKIFAPGRLRAHGHREKSAGNVIFVALNAAPFRQSLAQYQFRLWLLAGLGVGSLFSLAALVWYVRNYLISRRKFRNAEAMARQVIQSYPAAMIVTDPAGKIIIRNDAAVALFPKSAQLGQIRDWGGIDWNGLIDELESGGKIFEREREIMRPSGKFAPVNISAARIMEADGGRAGFLFILADLRAVKALERKLAESRRLSALGKLAAGVAHEIRNPLGAICGYACYLEQKLASDSMASVTARLLVEESRRLNNVVSDLLNLAREPKLNQQNTQVLTLLRKLELLVKPDAEAKGIELAIAADADLNACFDSDKLLQALLNLVLNGVQATAKGGSVRIGASALSANAPDLPAEARQGEDWLSIEIRDTGTGMTEEALSQIFTPYFTTRANGSGLGLPLARQIVEAHGGRIRVVSVLGRGSVFSVYLPFRATQ